MSTEETDLHDKFDGARGVAKFAYVDYIGLFDGVQSGQGVFKDGHGHCQLSLTLLLDLTCHISLYAHTTGFQPQHSVYYMSICQVVMRAFAKHSDCM